MLLHSPRENLPYAIYSTSPHAMARYSTILGSILLYTCYAKLFVLLYYTLVYSTLFVSTIFYLCCPTRPDPFYSILFHAILHDWILLTS